MSDEVIIKTKYCNPNMSFGSPDGCDEVTLKLPKSEVVKLQSSVVSQISLFPILIIQSRRNSGGWLLRQPFSCGSLQRE